MPTTYEKLEDNVPVVPFNKIVRDVEKGKLDLGFFKKSHPIKKKIGNTVIGGFVFGIESYLAHLASEYFLIYGAEGGKLLTLGSPTLDEIFIPGKAAVSWACYITNFLLALYFSIDITLAGRQSYLNYQYAKANNLPISIKKTIAILMIGCIMSLIGSIPSLIIALITKSPLEESATEIDNTLFNLIGCLFLINLCVFLAKNIGNKCHENKKTTLVSKKGSINDNTVNVKDFLRDFSNNLEELETLEDYQFERATPSELLLPDTSQTPLLSKNKETTCKTVAKTIGFTIHHTILQFFNVVSCASLFLSTADEAGKLFHIDNPALKYFVGSTIFFISSAIMVKVTYDTGEKILSLFKNQHKSSFADKLFLVPKLITIGGGYYLAFLSSSTTLALNEEYHLKPFWVKVVSEGGVVVFNGYGGMELINQFFNFLKEKLFYSKEKYKIITIGRKTQQLLESFPDNTMISLSR